MIDSHCHIYAEQFQEDLEEMLQRAQEAGVHSLLLPNIDLSSLEGMKELAKHKGIYPMMGLHPCSVQSDYKEILPQIRAEFGNLPCVAVGEIGIDLYWDKTTQSWQEDAFRIQCQWALDMDLPIVIHSRESIDLILEILESEYRGIRGVFHCFTGDALQAERIMDLGMYVGLGGVLTFKNTHLREVVVDIPLDRILLETDSPYLAPVPHRGKRNEPAYLRFVLEQLAQTLDMDPAKLDAQIEDNTLRLFKI